jgi:predicted nucleotidyltransferase
MPIIKDYKYFSDNPTILKVEARKLDDTLKNNFDLIVMDIEGSEYFALKGMKKILSHAKHLIVEFLPHHLKNVSGVSVKEFLKVIDPYFNSLYIPSKKITVNKSNFLKILENMYNSEESDEGIVFSKK